MTIVIPELILRYQVPPLGPFTQAWHPWRPQGHAVPMDHNPSRLPRLAIITMLSFSLSQVASLPKEAGSLRSPALTIPRATHHSGPLASSLRPFWALPATSRIAGLFREHLLYAQLNFGGTQNYCLTFGHIYKALCFTKHAYRLNYV